MARHTALAFCTFFLSRFAEEACITFYVPASLSPRVSLRCCLHIIHLRQSALFICETNRYLGRTAYVCSGVRHALLGRCGGGRDWAARTARCCAAHGIRATLNNGGRDWRCGAAHLLLGRASRLDMRLASAMGGCGLDGHIYSRYCHSLALPEVIGAAAAAQFLLRRGCCFFAAANCGNAQREERATDACSLPSNSLRRFSSRTGCHGPLAVREDASRGPAARGRRHLLLLPLPRLPPGPRTQTPGSRHAAHIAAQPCSRRRRRRRGGEASLAS